MNRKGISFGKISLYNAKNSSTNQNETTTSGFGTFGRIPIQDQKDVEETAEDLETKHVENVMGIKNFGKKPKTFNIHELLEQAKITARENARNKDDSENNTDENAGDSDEENMIGPLPSKEDSKEENDDDLIGPPIPAELLSQSSSSKTGT